MNAAKDIVEIFIADAAIYNLFKEGAVIFQMITNGEQSFTRVLAIMPDGKNGAPCGACRELMVQLMPDTYKDVQILMDYETERIVTLGEITPEWWI